VQKQQTKKDGRGRNSRKGTGIDTWRANTWNKILSTVEGVRCAETTNKKDGGGRNSREGIGVETRRLRISKYTEKEGEHS
jgi:hypothetical protein